MSNRLALASASSNSTKEALGHKSDRTWHAYAAPIMTVDAQSIANGMPEDVSYARSSQSIAITRDLGAPKPHGSQMGMPSIVSEDNLEIAKSELSSRKSTRKTTLRRARQIQYRKERTAYMARSIDLDKSNSDSDFAKESQDEAFLRRPKPSAVFKQMLKYHPMQARVIETLWTAEKASLGECVKAMMALANPDAFKPFYPHPVLRPTKNGECPYCLDDLFGQKVSQGRRAEHLLQCHERKHCVTFCFQCAMFVADRLSSGHQCLDLDLARSGVYGVVLWKNLVISEGRRPHGVGQECEHRFWIDVRSLSNHIEACHLKKKVEGPNHVRLRVVVSWFYRRRTCESTFTRPIVSTFSVHCTFSRYQVQMIRIARLVQKNDIHSV